MSNRVMIKEISIYENNNLIDNYLKTSSGFLESMIDELSSLYNSLDSRIQKKILPPNTYKLLWASYDLTDLNDERRTFINKVTGADQQIGYLTSFDLTTISQVNDFNELVLLSGYDSVLLEGIPGDYINKYYRPENNVHYVELMHLYSEIGPLTKEDIKQILMAGNCMTINQFSGLAQSLFFSGDPYAGAMYSTDNPQRGRVVVNQNGKETTYASCSSSGCGPTALRNIAEAFFPAGTINLPDVIKAINEVNDTKTGIVRNETYFGSIEESCSLIGLNAEEITLVGNVIDYDDQGVIDAIDNGGMVIASINRRKPNGELGGGHYIAIVGYKKYKDANGKEKCKFLVIDSANDFVEGAGDYDAILKFSDDTVINNGAYAITKVENGEEIANAYHQANEQSFNESGSIISWQNEFNNEGYNVMQL